MLNMVTLFHSKCLLKCRGYKSIHCAIVDFSEKKQPLFTFCVFKRRKMNKQNKTVVKIIKGFNLPVGMRNSKSCQFHAAPASFILIMLFLFSSLEGDIAEVSKV